MVDVTIPNNWEPRHYQLDALQAFADGKRRQIHIWHRRAGKDSFSLNLSAIMAHREIGTYWHLFPKHTQARKAIFFGMDAAGVRFLDQAFPPQIRKATRSQEMMLELACGSTWQMAGSDHYDTLVGSNVRGVVFSEYALADPAAWDYIRPIIRENDGWAIFITTYRGKNHAYRMEQKVKGNPAWFTSNLDITQTRRADGTPVLTESDIAEEREEGMSEAMIQQEYYNSPLAAFPGAYWAQAMLDMQQQKRITRVAYEPALPVVVAFDLGLDDEMSLLYIQELNNEVRIIDSDSYRFTSIPDVCADMAKKPFEPVLLYLPHDAAVKGMNTMTTRERVFKNHGYKTVIVPSPAGSKLPGIDLGRQLLAQTWIDEGLDRVLDSFSGYRTEEKKNADGVFQLSPAHTFESHLADAWQCYAKGRKTKTLGPKWDKLDYSHQAVVA